MVKKAFRSVSRTFQELITNFDKMKYFNAKFYNPFSFKAIIIFSFRFQYFYKFFSVLDKTRVNLNKSVP